MKNSRILMIAVSAAIAMTFAGCGSEEKAPEVTPTPVPTATPTAVPATVTPAPTATPAPRVIGVKTSQSKFIYLTNSLGTNLREIYLRSSGTEDWEKNLIPSESIIQDNEQVQMYYSSGTSVTGSTSSEDTSAGEDSSSSLYDMKIVTADGNTYEIYSIETDDMEKATLTLDEDSGVAYLRYMSLASKSEKDTRENSQQTGYGEDSEDSYDYTEEYYDSTEDEYYDDSSDDGSGDYYYYDDSSDDGSGDYSDDGSGDDYDDSSDDGSGDDYDDSSDDGSGDDYDDSSDDGSGDYYDDSGDSYVDAGGDGGDDSGADYIDEGDIPWDY
ncbi:MAG TPA: hypothetical protein IAA05_01775 [Candidatus Blautia excrementipullorum]|nr:hypothetical protein [Candidatus Blautia excrementipullorum]